MKNLSLLLFRWIAVASLCFVSVESLAAPQSGTAAAKKEVLLGVAGAYVPGGFDSQADAYVVVNGYFPNGCYSWKGAEVTNVDTFDQEIRSYANVTPGLCPMIMMPYSKEIRLGKLASGTHRLKFMNGDGTYLQEFMKVE